MNWRWGLFSLLLLLSVSCGSLPAGEPYAPWAYADLRLLDPAEAKQPAQDILAIYTRSEDAELQIRLDFLDHAALPDYDLYIAFDVVPGGTSTLPIAARAAIEWDTLLVIPAVGELQGLNTAWQPRPDLALSVLRDPRLDTVTIGLNQPALFDAPAGKERPGRPQPQARRRMPAVRLEVFLTSPGDPALNDRAGPLHSDDAPPPPARVLFAFWNSFPAYTPATALRRWNGAHTGPLGGSHGLYPLLLAARRAGIPLALLDLKNPASLSALDYAGGTELVRQMALDGLLILPAVIPDLLPTNDGVSLGLPDPILDAQGEVARRFGLPSGLAAFALSEATPGFWPQSTSAGLVFARPPAANLSSQTSSDAPGASSAAGRPSPAEQARSSSLSPTHLHTWQGKRLILVPPELHLGEQATLEGPALEMRRAWIETALAAAQPGGEGALLLLGGSLPESTWGAAGPAQTSFQYILAHPWIQPLDAQRLLTLPAGEMLPHEAQAFETPASPGKAQRPASPIQPALSTEQNSDLLRALYQAPDNTLRQAAWQAYLALFAPVFPASPELPALRGAYAGQVWSLLAGAAWAAQPTVQADCTADPDRDGQAECVLSNERLYAQFEIERGELTFLFASRGREHPQEQEKPQIHQIIGPSSQWISGLSDPSGWDLSRGLAADPAVLTGAFAGPGSGYQAETPPGEGVVFALPGERARKHFWLASDVLQAQIEPGASSSAMTGAWQIPLALDAWQRFRPGWAGAYQAVSTPQGWLWRLEPGPSVQITSSAALAMQTFNDSRSFFSRPEDPNLDYPPAHTLPFPLALLTASAPGGFDLQISILDAAFPGASAAKDRLTP